MGNQQFSSDDLSDWELVHENKLNFPGSPNLVKHRKNNSLVGQKYCFHLNYDSSSFEKYHIRKNKLQRIIDFYGLEVKLKSWGCMDSLLDLTVITEHIPFRLSSFQNLDLPQTIYLLHETLQGFQQLANKGFLCYPNADMIGIKSNANVKVWINTNWSLNIGMKAKNEYCAVSEIVTVITKYQKSSLNETHNLRRLLSSNFQNSIRYIEKKYGHILNEGKFNLQRRIMTKILTNSNDSQNRPRAVSEGNKKFSIVTHQKASSVNNSNNHKSSVKKPLSCNLNGKQVHKTGQSQINTIQKPKTLEKNRVFQYKQIKQMPNNHQIFQKVNIVENFKQNQPKPMYKSLGSSPATKKYLNFIYKNPQKQNSQGAKDFASEKSMDSPFVQIFQSTKNSSSKHEQQEEYLNIGSVQNFKTFEEKNEIKKQSLQNIPEQQESQTSIESNPNILNLANEFKYYLRSAKIKEKDESGFSAISEEASSRSIDEEVDNNIPE